MSSKPFTTLSAISAPLMRINVDTDAIIPSREMKKVSKKGLGEGLFAGWRYREPGGRERNPDFILNRSGYDKAEVLLSGENFGCGSSREHAVWAMVEYGFRAIIAPSFGAIFYNNSIRNGLLPIILPEEDVQELANIALMGPDHYVLKINLPDQTVTSSAGKTYHFNITAQDKMMLIEGLDAIDLTLKLKDQITAFEKQDQATRPWARL